MRTSTFALIFGIAYLAAGVLGLIPAMLQPPPADAPATTFTLLYGYLLGLFPVNIILTAVHLATGFWGIAAWSGATHPGLYARSLALFYGALGIIGLIPGLHTMFGLVPLYGHDVWLHLGTAVIAAYFGWRSTAVSMERRRAAERRSIAVGVARERRMSMGDRRRDWGSMHPA
ncbi:MAG TPA: DUF4383 domain-containing protein [Burkholderiales bacterium]|nr:DUF4383 domain-containing protein [Burkholderiales bacterium]